MSQFILSIDQGTTSSRAMLFDENGRACFCAQEEFTQYFPNDGWVEHDPDEIWKTTLNVVRQALQKARDEGKAVLSIGITNQRETTVVWDKSTGQAVYNAIVWQDRRTAEFCNTLKKCGHEPLVTDRTGLLLDPYFSGTKVRWILENVEGARTKAEKGELLFGTIDCYLIWKLTAGKVHATDATNASRTLMYNINSLNWDDELLAMLEVPKGMLPEVKNCADDFGITDKHLLDAAIPICGVAGDQQAALIGQACFQPGMIKSTYGTGCFAILNTGSEVLKSSNKLLTTIGYQIDGKVSYALEGSIFIAGAAVQWLRDGLGVIGSAQETESLAASLQSNNGVYLVPAFTGLGAPHWDPDARGAIFGLTRDTGPADFARAALESVCYQTADLLQAMKQDGVKAESIRVDGGMVKNNWLCAQLADILGIPVQRPVETETTALGAAMLAGLQAGLYNDLTDAGAKWKSERSFEPVSSDHQREALMTNWRSAVQKVLSRH